MQFKDSIRLSQLQKRNTLTESLITEHSKRISDKLSNLPEFQQSQQIGLYWPLYGEIDTSLIVTKCWELKKACYLPKVIADFKMEFCRYDKNTSLKLNKFNIQEPINSETISPQNLDIVFVPMVAFDALGHRVGFGTGYYDRCFAFHEKNTLQQPLLVGIAHSFQEVNSIASDPWDVPLDRIITEEKIFYCSRYTHNA